MRIQKFSFASITLVLGAVLSTPTTTNFPLSLVEGAPIYEDPLMPPEGWLLVDKEPQAPLTTSTCKDMKGLFILKGLFKGVEGVGVGVQKIKKRCGWVARAKRRNERKRRCRARIFYRKNKDAKKVKHLCPKSCGLCYLEPTASPSTSEPTWTPTPKHSASPSTPSPSNIPPGKDVQYCQLGDGVNGEESYDYSGKSIALSGRGTIMAVGAMGNGKNSKGHVRVYELQYTGVDPPNWIQLGSDIDGEAEGDLSGSSVSLSNDGHILAVGASGNDGNKSDSGHVRLYKWTGVSGSGWVRFGSDIDGEAPGDESGSSVSLSGDGMKLAVGAWNNDGNGPDSGHVRVYDLNVSGVWLQLGSDIDGEASNDHSGSSVSISDDGMALAIASSRNGTPIQPYRGHVRVYDYDSAVNSWTQRGSDIDGEATRDFAGFAVSLSGDGTVVAVGAPRNDAGHVRVYEHRDYSWIQIGEDIDGEAFDDYSGAAVSLSYDGNVLAVGAYNNNQKKGHVRVYQWDGVWNQRGSDIDGERLEDYSGVAVSLSTDGNVLAVGSRRMFGDGLFTGAGHVKVYARWADTVCPTQM